MTRFSVNRLLRYILLTTAVVLAATAICLFTSYTAAAQTASAVEVSYTTRSDKQLEKSYLDWYSLSTDSSKEYYIKSYSMNGGNYGNNTPAKAFDGNFDTFWETNTVNSDTFKNQITVTFNKAVTIDRIFFATRRDGQWQKGFPLKATFYTSDDGVKYTSAASANAEVKNNVVLYTFSQPMNTKYIKFEYTEVYSGMTQHASASELIFMRPEEDIIVEIKNMFSDYMQTSLKPQYADRDAILELKEQLSDHPLYSDLEEYLNRALSIIDGTLMADPINRQFTTDPDARGRLIQQRGDLIDYGHDLHFMFNLTNYLPTGIYGNTGEKIKIYVEADEGQPLPKVAFTQFLTTYQYWQGGQIELRRGVNELTVPSFTHDASFTNAGGPIYLLNPYTPDEQNESVKIYIEGGHTYPVFYKGGSEEKFLNDIADFTEYYNENKSTAFNIVEILSDHMLVTAQATRAEEIYIDNGVSVQTVCENWDKYMQSLLEFNGVTFDKSDRYYDSRVQKLYLNVRIMQPFSSAADAYATGQHIGIRKNTGWETTALNASGFGWGTSHEIGHIIEIGEYRVLEYTNNMVSNFNETILDGLSSRGDHNKVTTLLAPDDTTGITSGGGSYDNTYVVWWNIESVLPGYWGRYNNLFRYGVPQGYPSADGMSAVEKQVYYTSIATGIDTGYYFDRYGYRFNNNEFDISKASDAYLNAVSKLKAEGKLSDKQLKFWYAGGNTATLNYKYGDKLSVYNEKITISPLYIGKESGGYRINLPDNSANIAHLGYEIIESGKVIGFTTISTYLDQTVYADGYTPRYQVRAYDQKLNATATSEVWQFDAQSAVAQTGGKTYGSLAEAVSEAEDNGVVVLLADIAEENITIDKNLTITNDGKSVYILKTGSGNIFDIQSGVTLTVKGSADAPIIFDGSGVAREGRVFSSAGKLELSYLEFINLNSTSADGTVINLWGQDNTLSISRCSFTNIMGCGRGGAVYVVANDTINVTIDECSFSNVRTTGSFNGGALFMGAPTTITNSIFKDNRADKNSGGAIYIGGKDSVLRGCEFSGNYANALDYRGGGALYINNKCTVEDCSFTGNSAFTGANGGSGGAVYIASGGAEFIACTFSGNKAFAAGAVYIGAGVTQFKDCVIEGNSSGSNGGAVYVNWSQSEVSAAFDGCTITNNSCSGNGIIYINYYYYYANSDYGLGQKLLNFTNSVLKDNTSGGATVFTNYVWLRLNAEGSEIYASVNKKTELLSGYEKLYITLMQDTGIDGEIVRRSDTPMTDDVYDHFILSDALSIKYRLELGQTGNSLWLRQLSFNLVFDNNGQISTDDTPRVYGDAFTMPSAPAPLEGHTFTGWEYGGKVYQPGEEVQLVSGNKITAMYEKYLFDIILVYSESHSITAGAYQKGDIINVSDFTAPTDKNFIGWMYKGAVYLPGDKIVFDGRNDTFVAVYNTPGEETPDENPDGDSQTPGGDDQTPGGDETPDDGQTPGGGDENPEQQSYAWIIAVVVVAVAVCSLIAIIIVVNKRRHSDK